MNEEHLVEPEEDQPGARESEECAHAMRIRRPRNATRPKALPHAEGDPERDRTREREEAARQDVGHVEGLLRESKQDVAGDHPVDRRPLAMHDLRSPQRDLARREKCRDDEEDRETANDQPAFATKTSFHVGKKR